MNNLSTYIYLLLSFLLLFSTVSHFNVVQAENLDELDDILGIKMTEKLNVTMLSTCYTAHCESSSSQPGYEQNFDDDDILKFIQSSPQPDDSFNSGRFNDNRFNQDLDEITGFQRNEALIGGMANDAMYGGGSNDNEVQSSRISSNAIYGGGADENRAQSSGSCAALCSDCVLM